MFPFNFQLSDNFCEDFGRKSRIGFSVAMSRFLCLLKHLSEVSITKSNLVWCSIFHIMRLDCQGKDFTARMCDRFYAKVILSL